MRLGGEVEFFLDELSAFNSESVKGLMFSSNPPKRVKDEPLHSCRIETVDLDQFESYFVTKRLRINWYIFLFVSK